MRAEQLASVLVAHRGHQTQYPENTLLALQKAREQGVTHLEFDIQLTADRVPILHHDLSLYRMCGVRKPITSVNLAQAKHFRAQERKRLGHRFAAQRLTTLQEVIDWASGDAELHLFVEVKEESIAAFGIEAVLEAVIPVLHPLAGRATLISFDQAFVTQASQHWSQVGPVLRAWPPSRFLLSQMQPSVLFINRRRVPPRARLDRFDIPVVVYEIDTAKRAQRWLQRGAAMLETFSCAELMADWRGRFD